MPWRPVFVAESRQPARVPQLNPWKHNPSPLGLLNGKHPSVEFTTAIIYSTVASVHEGSLINYPGTTALN